MRKFLRNNNERCEFITDWLKSIGFSVEFKSKSLHYLYVTINGIDTSIFISTDMALMGIPHKKLAPFIYVHFFNEGHTGHNDTYIGDIEKSKAIINNFLMTAEEWIKANERTSTKHQNR